MVVHHHHRQSASRHHLYALFPYLRIVVSALIGWICAGTILNILLDRASIDWSDRQSVRRSLTSAAGDYNPAALKEEVIITKTATSSPIRRGGRETNCTFWRCFNPYRCNYYGDYRLTVYVYPLRGYVVEERTTKNGTTKTSRATTQPPSKEFIQILNAIRTSPYYEPDPAKACVFVPSIDTLNEERLNMESSKTTLVGDALASLKWWNNGENHLIFNMLPGIRPRYDSALGLPVGRAILAGGGFSVRTYRRTFDVSIPVYNPWTARVAASERADMKPTRLLISTKPFPTNDDIRILRVLQNKYPNDFLLLVGCDKVDRDHDHPFDISVRCSNEQEEGRFQYPDVLQTSKYCLILAGNRLGQPELSDALQFGCVPVVVIDEYVLPFSEVLDWKRAAVLIYRHQLPELVEILKRDIPDRRYVSMRSQGAWFWKAYFGSLANIASTTLRILQDRVFPHQVRSYDEWNDNKLTLFPSAFFGDRVAPNDGFTAVILTYDRVATLFRQITQLSRVQSLAKIIVVWNNQQKAPPPAKEWPKLNKPLKIIRTSENRLTNRFVPYNEIETEAVLSLDDDILMLNSDELEFGYQAWREFPSYLVGYPSRVHVFDTVSQRWTYESEWTNNASMILTGAAFYHNYYNLLFTETLPRRVKNWIDNMMNCEDIAMNFMIANYTGQPALKVTPRKKFKPTDSTATTGQDLSADSAHLKQRSECLNRLSRYFGGMVLKSVEFRLDPLLYKVDVVPAEAKLYPDVGHL